MLPRLRVALHHLVFAAMLCISAGSATAQDSTRAYIQVEAQPTLAMAQQRVRAYAGALPDVSGWALPSGWYAIVLGPYSRTDAAIYLDQLMTEAQAPNDSYIVDGAQFRQQFWPIGLGVASTPLPIPMNSGRPVNVPPPGPAPVTPLPVTPQPINPQPAPTAQAETVEQALAAEGALSNGDKRLLQSAMRDAGVYGGAIDGLFGRGTRDAMAAWQAQNGYSPLTGVLTTDQRAALMAQYNAVLDDLGIERTVYDMAGIEIDLPTAVVNFQEVTPPFARWQSDDGAYAVLLISQPGDRARLASLAATLQSLPFVPAGADVQVSATGLSITGASGDSRIRIEAGLHDGAIKGYGLIWPAADPAFDRLFARMQQSFRAIPGVLAAPAAAAQADTALTAGLSLDAPRLVQAGIYIDAQGLVLTAAAPLAQCSRIALNGDTPARITQTAGEMALLQPELRIAPTAVARFATPQDGAAITGAGYPYGHTLAQASTTPGQITALDGLTGTADHLRLTMQATAGDIGGPLLDAGGDVVGMLLPQTAGLPQTVQIAASSGAIARLINAPAPLAVISAPIAPEAVSTRARLITAQISCW
ncbi:serine protease [Ketogulonicigenium vulgare]|uniref:Peptidoglycan binding domain protein n=2 Tax=Ketogulonicigenium vulgare TaxID=92945 RepID=F9YA47_KETVW|nr:serine protease [Ketogulonicigenium vulgare]AEM41458.1 Peptidoglycan binding domain protein [Ketogulonicigenium vulgare WSH-001]ALJ81592.1 hypothetical protein KVH_10640 [Ketogulonicigenium vulgare]AOZ55198.1 Peptidoglycan binding domain protein [Ketogulonicigenium vulgare]